MAVYGNLSVVTSDNAAYVKDNTYPVIIHDDGTFNIEVPDEDGKLSNGQVTATPGAHVLEETPNYEQTEPPTVV